MRVGLFLEIMYLGKVGIVCNSWKSWKMKKKSGNSVEICTNFVKFGGIWEHHQISSSEISEILLYSYLNPDVESIIHEPSVSLSRHVPKNKSLSERSQSSADT